MEYKTILKKLEKAEQCLKYNGFNICYECEQWRKPCSGCIRCDVNLCYDCYEKVDTEYCLICRHRHCHKCIIHEINTRQTKRHEYDSTYICLKCFKEPKIEKFIPNYYTELPKYYKDQILIGLLSMNTINKPPKFIKYLIFNYLFQGMNKHSDLCFSRCCNLIKKSECGYPIFTPNTKYCQSCQGRHER